MPGQPSEICEALVAKAFEEQQIISRFKRNLEHPVREQAFDYDSLGGYSYCLHETHLLSLACVERSPWHWHPKCTTCQSQQRELAQFCINSSCNENLVWPWPYTHSGGQWLLSAFQSTLLAQSFLGIALELSHGLADIWTRCISRLSCWSRDREQLTSSC